MGISYDHLLLHIMQGTCNSVLYTKKNIFKKLVFPEKCLNGQILPVQMSPGQMLHGQMSYVQFLPSQVLIDQILTGFHDKGSLDVLIKSMDTYIIYIRERC